LFAALAYPGIFGDVHQQDARLAEKTMRVSGLDGIRGVAILLVVLSHVSARRFSDEGVAGVSLFFILSGYLITSILLNEYDGAAGVRFSAFYARRALRLLPAMLVLIVSLPLLLLVVNDPRLDNYAQQALAPILYIEDYVAALGHASSTLEHTWSLGVEEQFYLVWPLVLVFLVRRLSLAGFVRAVILLAFLALAWHILAMVTISGRWTYYSADANGVSLLGGCALSVWSRHRGAPHVPAGVGYVALASIIAVSFVATPFDGADWRVRNWLVPVVTLLGIVVIAAANRMSALSLTPLVWTGRISYGLYLWHGVLLTLLPNGHPLSASQRIAAAAMSFIAAIASWFLVEMPALRIKRRFEHATLLLSKRTRPQVLDNDHAVQGEC
jgi:peptidoglycan/LPS O-acetylase OafA/YrhL